MTTQSNERASLGIIGSRGYVGKELLALVEGHGGFDLRLSVSARDGKTPADIASEKLDAYVLAVPNGQSGAYVEAITAARPDAVIVDLGADYRFDDAWTYGQPERLRSKIATAKRIANPGCYATATQLALAPLVPLLEGPPSIFGVSGYSGAGTTPSPKNDPAVLADNLLPYSLTSHIHEREVARQLGCRLFLMPHVAPFFRGITVTVSVALREAHELPAIDALYRAAYDAEPMVHYGKEAPLVRDIAGKHHVAIGGLDVSRDGQHAVVIATIDNLLGGAATQAVRNLNLALGMPELRGIPQTEAPAHAATS